MDIVNGNVSVNYNGEQHELDMILLKLAFDELEADYPSKERNGFIQPSADFLKALAAALDADFGLKGATATAAYQIWVGVSSGFMELKKSIESTPS
jgi:hypothetical protein